MSETGSKWVRLTRNEWDLTGLYLWENLQGMLCLRLRLDSSTECVPPPRRTSSIPASSSTSVGWWAWPMEAGTTTPASSSSPSTVLTNSQTTTHSLGRLVCVCMCMCVHACVCVCACVNMCTCVWHRRRNSAPIIPHKWGHLYTAVWSVRQCVLFPRSQGTLSRTWSDWIKCETVCAVSQVTGDTLYNMIRLNQVWDSVCCFPGHRGYSLQHDQLKDAKGCPHEPIPKIIKAKVRLMCWH